MARLAAIYTATLIVLAVADAAWLTLVAGPMFQAVLGDVLRAAPLLPAAILFYLVYAAGLVALAVLPGLERRSLARAAVGGALVGLTAYATFDLTSLAIIRGWTVTLAAIDIGWGVAMSAAAAAAGCQAGLWVGGPETPASGRGSRAG